MRDLLTIASACLMAGAIAMVILIAMPVIVIVQVYKFVRREWEWKDVSRINLRDACGK